jgi:hypothetical protein
MPTQTPTPPATPVAAPVQNGGLGSLQTQVGDLRIELAGLKAQWDGLRRQLDNMLQSNPARPGVQQQWADVGVQIAKVEGNIATLDARISQQQGRPVGSPNIPVIPRWFNPNAVVPAVSIVTLVLALPISIALAKRILGRGPRAASASVPADVTMRLDRIEHAVDTVAIEVERISEGQRFVTKVMAGRAAASSANVSDEARQPLALGAGPMEPIVVAERESVRQRIVTPH